MIKKTLVALGVVLALLQWGAWAEGKSGLNEQLMEAAPRGDVPLLQGLIKKGADVNALDSRGWSTLRHAAAEKRIDAVKLLKSNGARMTLIIAAILGDSEEVQRLVASGSDLCQRDDEGFTPLVEASRHENIDVVRLLLDLGADPNEPDNVDQTALMLAALTGQLSVVKLLIAKGADMNAGFIRAGPHYPRLRGHGTEQSRAF